MKSGIRYGKFNMAFFAAFIAVMAVTIAVMLLGIIDETSATYARYYSLETVSKLESYLIREIALVERVASSNAVIDWFTDEGNEDKRLAAYNEMTDYTEIFASAGLYFGINASLSEFSIDKGAGIEELVPFDTLNPEADYDAWYFECINSDKPYQLNLDVDKVKKSKSVWINCKVTDGGKPVGVFCASLNFDEVFADLFEGYDVEHTMGLIVDVGGYVQIHSADKDFGMVYNDYADFDDSNLPLVTDFYDDNAFASAIVKRLASAHYTKDEEAVIVRLESSDYDYASIAAIAATDWTAVTFFNSASLFGVDRFLPLIGVIIILLTAYLFTSNILLRRYHVYNKELVSSRDEKKELAEKNQILNSVAERLLSASDDMGFEASLVNGMHLLADGADADRVMIWQNETRDGSLCYICKYKWLSQSGRRGPAPLPTDSFMYSESSPECVTTLSRGECINGPVADLPIGDRNTFEPKGIVSLLLIPIHLKNNFWGFVSFADCVRERVFTKEEVSLLRSGALMLASAVNRNTQELEVRDALAAAQAASKAKGNFLSNMSHEIRTPLNAIIGMTAIGSATDDASRKARAFEKIEGASSHLLGVVNDILDMSKIEAGKFNLSVVPFDFDGLLKRVVSVVNFRLEEKRQIFTLQIDERIPASLMGDDTRLAQVITNLVSNAIKFTPEGKQIKLDASLTGVANGVYTVRVSVSDKGIGISEEQQSRLFKSFEQAENDTARKYGGTGLGLAISKHIVEQMGGRLLLKSKPGAGSEFYFSVPLKIADPAKPASEDNPDEAGLGNVFADKRLLLVEDVEINREIVATLLEPTLIKTDFAENGAEAVSKVKEASESRQYDLIFMDLQMPAVDGFEATRQIRALGTPGADTVPIIAMTANVFREDVEKCLAAGMNGHLGKPLDFDAVMNKLREYLR